MFDLLASLSLDTHKQGFHVQKLRRATKNSRELRGAREKIANTNKGMCHISLDLIRSPLPLVYLKPIVVTLTCIYFTSSGVNGTKEVILNSL